MTAYHDSPRTKNMTVLMPEAMFEDLRALRMATDQSSNDLINELLEAHLSSCAEVVEFGRELLRLKAEGSRRREGRAEAARGPDPPAEALAMPDDAFIEGWAKGEGKPTKAERFSKQYAAWCRSEGKPFGTSSTEFAAEVLMKEYSKETADTYRRMIGRMIAAWQGRARYVRP